MAIILAGYNPSLKLLGVSTIGGNQMLSKVTQNALDVLDSIGLSHIMVAKGQQNPILRPIQLCPEIHGDSGLDSLEKGRPLFPRSTRNPVSDKAVLTMYKVLTDAHASYKAKVKLICTGPMTNAALLLTLFPEVKESIDLVFMGGAIGVGNTNPVAEFNMEVDPEASKIVFQSGVDLTMVPLEVTHTLLVTPRVLSEIEGERPTPFRAAIQQLLLYFATSYKAVFNFEHPPLHDPAAVAFVIAPQLFKYNAMRVEIEVASPISAGQTVCDVWVEIEIAEKLQGLTAVDVDAFWDLMVGAVA
eukprot:CAMPEP_0175044782 /NCGR_PEP_ID=MMETSP0052_2-20121109/4021_1 /TAXON_ID=51329 ORGANISM="Polytomella parva, Strain SAG 63-3" /NCGR_SAMPLE_ID=MMETSP0052_2 /ASSEMBLY_ACC=CAM_ASM_000194 /LENGTH=300 /DNA_ID=CAMNT_0016308165 /DNA_START=103 /DNA_END=1002 /DNA_ORIENTATION=-